VSHTTFNSKIYVVVTSYNTMQPTYLSFCHKISSNQKTQLSKNLEEKKLDEVAEEEYQSGQAERGQQKEKNQTRKNE
jgi:hypothetical protein